MARLHPEQFLNVASISLNARFQSKDVAEFDSIRGRNNARDAVDAEDGMPQRTASSSAEATADRTGCVRGSQYAIYSNSDKAGDVYGDYGLVIAAFSRIIRSAEVDLHAAVVDRERNLVIIGKMFD